MHSSTQLETISSTQAAPEVTANQLFDALSPAMLFGRHAEACAGLTWGYYGGVLNASGTPTVIANGTVTLAANSTNYVEATTAGVVSANQSGFTGGRIRLYIVYTGAAGVLAGDPFDSPPGGYIDYRTPDLGSASVGGLTAPFSDTTSLVQGSADATKELRIEVDGLTTATTRVVTAQDRDGTMALEENLPATIGIAVGDETSTITTGTAKTTFRMPHAMTLTAVRASLTTASSSGTPTVDINENGSTILSTKITIDANETTSTTAATPPVISDAALADDAEITIDIDVAGTGAKGLKVWLIGRRA
jgi:hypothetical protein